MDNNLPYKEVSVFAVPADITACGKLRVIYPIEYIRRGGANISCKPMLREMDIVRYPVILLQRQVSEDAYKTVKRAVDRGQIVVYELDDDLWNIDEDSPARRVYYPGSDALKWAEKIVSACTGVFASTTNLGKKLSRFNPNVHVIENSLDLQLGIRDWTTREPRTTDKVVFSSNLGITHQIDIPHIAQIAGAILEKYPESIFSIGGPEIFYQDLLGKHGLPEDRVMFLPPREFDEYPRMQAHSDIGICPLHDSEFNRSKCLELNTRVKREDKEVKIKDLKVGEKIWNGSRFVKVEAIELQNLSEGVKIVTASDHLKMTLDHRVKTDLGWRKASQIQVGERIFRESWSEPVEEIIPIELESVDIQVEGEVFIANGFISHNSFLKPLEFGAWGVPSVCAPVQPYFEFDKRHGGMIAIADTIDDWVREVGKLIEDENLRKQKGSQLKSLVWWDYNLETNHRKWLDGFNIIYDRSIKGETFNPYDPGPNDPCWCGSGKKFKKCHRK